MPRYVIVFLLPDVLNDFLNPIREYFEKGVSLKIPPHISLTFPFYINSLSEEELFQKIMVIGKKNNPLAIGLNGIKTFQRENGRKVIYSSLAKEEGVKKLNSELMGVLKEHITIDLSVFPGNMSPSFVPHATLVLNGTDKDQKYVEERFANFSPRNFLADKFFILVSHNPQKTWKAERMVLMGKLGI